MTEANHADGKGKVTTKLPLVLRRQLKLRAAELSIDMQDAAAAALDGWILSSGPYPTVDTANAESYSTTLPLDSWQRFRDVCEGRSVSYIQGLSQAIKMWLDAHPSTGRKVARLLLRLVVCNQKGGVGKTVTAAGLAQAFAEDGKRVLLVDYDPQGHLTEQLGLETLDGDGDTLLLHMVRRATGDIKDLLVPLKHTRFGGSLYVLPASMDAFLLDLELGKAVARERALEHALEPLEDDFDVIIIDCPPSLGLAVDAALFYGRERDQESSPNAGVLVPVQAEPSSRRAYNMLVGQIDGLCEPLKIDIPIVGLVVTQYDPRRGAVATGSLKRWQALEEPPVLAVVPDLKEQREADDAHRPLLDYAPNSPQAKVHRELAEKLSA